MSDADWDMEYSKAYYLEKELKKYCQEYNLEYPVLSKYARSWEIQAILDILKEIHTGEVG